MKPTKNRFFCRDCGRLKMLFETENKADNFINFNSSNIEQETGFKPVRTYFCIYCGGWHVTSQKDDLNIKSRTEIVLDRYQEEKENKILFQERKSLVRVEKQKELKEILTLLENNISILERFEITSTSYFETFQKAINDFQKAYSLKGNSFKGSSKKIKSAEKKIKLIRDKIKTMRSNGKTTNNPYTDILNYVFTDN